jgi:alkylation response protein AidB-like acyl-CoA dehydrogenase
MADREIGLEEYRERARTWLSEVERPEVPSDYDERFAVLRRWQRTLFDGGWVGIQWPERFGGQGLTIRHTLVFDEELLRARLPQPIGSIGLEVVGPTILGHGTDEQRQRLLPPLLSGEELWGQGFSEPDAGSDLAGLRAKAVRDGDELVLSGQKVWTSWASDADWCAVLARTDPEAPRHRGISYLLVDMKSPGVTVTPIIHMNGDAEFNELFFDEVRVPVENVLTGFGEGWRLAMDTLGHERSSFVLRRAMENQSSFIDLVDDVRSGIAGGEGPPEDVVADLGELFVAMKTMEAQTRDTARRVGSGNVPSPLDSIDKLTLTETEQHLYAAAVELLGAERMVVGARPNGLPVERWMPGLMYARSASIYGGSSQIQRSIIAERHLGLPRGR